jgi:hypothetical protein
MTEEAARTYSVHPNWRYEALAASRSARLAYGYEYATIGNMNSLLLCHNAGLYEIILEILD